MSRLALVVLAAIFALAATTGITTGAFKTKRASTTLGADEVGSATAKCKRKTQAVSGGFDAPNFDPLFNTGPSIETFASKRNSKRQWTTTAYNFVGEGELAAFAYCSGELPKLKARSATAEVPNGTIGSATAKCKQGEEAVSGGFSTTLPADGPIMFPSESRRSGKRAWVASARSVGSDTSVTSYVYCSPEKLGLKTRSKTVSTTPPEQDFVVSATPKCKRRQTAIAGGFTATFNPGCDSAEVIGSQRAGKRGWTGSVAAFADDEGLEWEVFVYCLKKKKA
jgi:hypothetical protein